MSEEHGDMISDFGNGAEVKAEDCYNNVHPR